MTTDPSRHLAEADLYTRSASRLALLFFSRLDELGRFEPVGVDDLPPVARSLLAHHEHMTVALESHYDSLVAVRAVAEWQDEASYARCSLLSRQSDGAIVQFGIMRIWLADLPEDARREITEQKEPLGRVLINHNLLREVEVIALWRITPGPVLKQQLQLAEDKPRDCRPRPQARRWSTHSVRRRQRCNRIQLNLEPFSAIHLQATENTEFTEIDLFEPFAM